MFRFICCLCLGLPLFSSVEQVKGIPAEVYLAHWPNLQPAVSLLEANRLNEAKILLKEMAFQGQDEGGALNLLAQILRDAGEFDDATKQVERAMAAEPDEDLHCVQYAMIAVGRISNTSSGLTQWKWAQKAYNYYEQALNLNPKAYNARIYLVLHKLTAPAIAGGDKPEAIKMAKEGLAIGDRAAHLLLGCAYLASDQTETGWDEIKKGMDQKEFDDQLLLYAAKNVAELKQYERSEACFDYMLTTMPNSPLPHYYRGNYFMRRDLDQQAADCYRMALTIDPNYQKAKKKLDQLN